MAEHNDLGTWGESIARAYLKDNGYAIVAANWRYKKIELDILARKGDLLAVVEVKTRKHTTPEPPVNSITLAKQKRIITAANFYVQEKELDVEVRLDVIVILTEGTHYTLEHIEEAFYPQA